MAYKINAIGDVEEAIHGPVASRRTLPRQGRMARTWHAEAGPRGDSQEIEVRITGGKLTLQLEHV
jgi:hypothetical protein